MGDLDTVAKEAGRQLRRRVAAGMLLLVAITVAVTALAFTLKTRGDVTVIKAASRCQRGELAACRRVGANIVRSCTVASTGPLHGRDLLVARHDCNLIRAAILEGGFGKP